MKASRIYSTVLFTISLLVVTLAGCGKDEQVFDTELVIDSLPKSGAHIQLNGQDYGVTPQHVRGLPPGPVLVDLTLDGYRRTYDTYKVPDQGLASYTLTMPQLVGEITIDSDPPNAEVYLNDGTPLGHTPLRGIKLPEGPHTIELRLDKYEPRTEQLDVKADYKYTKSFTLAARQSRVEVFSSPSGASIWLNNTLQKEKTPARLPVQPGTYTVGVYTRGYIMAEEVITIGPASDATVNLQLKEGAVPPGMMLVPGGEFTMGTDDRAPDEKPRRKVNVEAFYIDKYEVTNEQFAEVIPTYTFKKGQEQYPVVGVSWEEATEYAREAKKRLPTEIEWEKAARGTDVREYPWGAKWDPDLVNVNTGQAGLKLIPVGQSRGNASPYGCLDMSGNAYEWTSSWYAAYPGNTEIVKEYGQVFRVLRGGSYLKGEFEARCASRHYDLSTAKREDYGFRCAADVEQGPPGKVLK